MSEVPSSFKRFLLREDKQHHLFSNHLVFAWRIPLEVGHDTAGRGAPKGTGVSRPSACQSGWSTTRPHATDFQIPRQSVHDLLRPSLCIPWEEVRDQLNAKLVGWQNYFRYGNGGEGVSGSESLRLRSCQALSSASAQGHLIQRQYSVFRSLRCSVR